MTPPAQVHLVTCSAFLSSANKAEFLDLGYVSGAGAAGRPVHPAAVPRGGRCTPLRCQAPGQGAGHPSGHLAAAFQQLMERLQRIVQLPHRLRPAQTSKVEPRRPPGAEPRPAAPRGQPRLPALPRPPLTSSSSHPQINSEYRAEFARCLEPLLMLSPRRSVVGSAGGIGPGMAGANM